jgi:hypothetical protein
VGPLSAPRQIFREKSSRLIAVFVGVVGTAILAVGFLFNALLQQADGEDS